MYILYFISLNCRLWEFWKTFKIIVRKHYSIGSILVTEIDCKTVVAIGFQFARRKLLRIDCIVWWCNWIFLSLPQMCWWGRFQSWQGLNRFSWYYSDIFKQCYIKMNWTMNGFRYYIANTMPTAPIRSKQQQDQTKLIIFPPKPHLIAETLLMKDYIKVFIVCHHQRKLKYLYGFSSEEQRNIITQWYKVECGNALNWTYLAGIPHLTVFDIILNMKKSNDQSWKFQVGTSSTTKLA